MAVFPRGWKWPGTNACWEWILNRDAVATFQRNHPWAQAHCGDISLLDERALKQFIGGKKIDVVIAGPPCQGFSTVGRGDAQDKRNGLFLQFVRIVEILNPKMIVMENVTGMLAKKNRATLKAIFRSFERLGYFMDARVLSSEEYGVPEIRRRTIIMGGKDGLMPEFPRITHGKRGKWPLHTVGDALKSLHTEGGKRFNHDEQEAQIKNELDFKRLKCIPEGKGIRYSQDEEEYLPKRLRYGVDWDELAEGRFRQTKLQRLNRNLPAPTILTSSSSYYHPSKHRYLTAREAAACQSFPNDFVFSGRRTAQFRQIGNAVPPVLARAIGKKLIKIFNYKKKTKAKEAKRHFDKNAFSYANNTIT